MRRNLGRPQSSRAVYKFTPNEVNAMYSAVWTAAPCTRIGRIAISYSEYCGKSSIVLASTSLHGRDNSTSLPFAAVAWSTSRIRKINRNAASLRGHHNDPHATLTACLTRRNPLPCSLRAFVSSGSLADAAACICCGFECPPKYLVLHLAPLSLRRYQLMVFQAPGYAIRTV